MFSNRSTGARREFHNQTKPSHLFRGDSTWAEPVNWAHEPYKLGQKFRLVETRRPSDPSFSNPFHASHAALARETRPPPRFVDLPRTGQSPREGKKIRSTSGATSEITITRPLLHKTRPFPSLARFSNRRNSTSCPSFLILENTPALLLLYSRGMHVDPPVKTPFTVISFFFLFFSRVSERSLIFRITHPQFCIPLRVYKVKNFEGEVKLWCIIHVDDLMKSFCVISHDIFCYFIILNPNVAFIIRRWRKKIIVAFHCDEVYTINCRFTKI